EPVDLREIIADAGETGELLAEHAGVGMEIRLPPEPVVVSVDRSRVRQLALNLIENAVKYTPRGGQVSVELAGSDGRAMFTVADTTNCHGGVRHCWWVLPSTYTRSRSDAGEDASSDIPGVDAAIWNRRSRRLEGSDKHTPRCSIQRGWDARESRPGSRSALM